MSNDVDWDRARLIMERSIRGRPPTDEERDFIARLFKLDVQRYKMLHDEVREEAHREMRRGIWGPAG